MDEIWKFLKCVPTGFGVNDTWDALGTEHANGMDEISLIHLAPRFVSRRCLKYILQLPGMDPNLPHHWVFSYLQERVYMKVTWMQTKIGKRASKV